MGLLQGSSTSQLTLLIPLLGAVGTIPALAGLSDPTPEGFNEAQSFSDPYAELATDPSAYGYYQFRFIIDSIDRRADLDFESLLLDTTTE